MRGVFGRCLFHSVFRYFCMNKIDMEMFELCVCVCVVFQLVACFKLARRHWSRMNRQPHLEKKSCPLVPGSVQV